MYYISWDDLVLREKKRNKWAIQWSKPSSQGDRGPDIVYIHFPSHIPEIKTWNCVSKKLEGIINIIVHWCLAVQDNRAPSWCSGNYHWFSFKKYSSSNCTSIEGNSSSLYRGSLPIICTTSWSLSIPMAFRTIIIGT